MKVIKNKESFKLQNFENLKIGISLEWKGKREQKTQVGMLKDERMNNFCANFFLLFSILKIFSTHIWN